MAITRYKMGYKCTCAAVIFVCISYVRSVKSESNTTIPVVNTTYESTWESLDKRPLPRWYDTAKFGILLHWGLYSVPSFSNEWFWSNWKKSYEKVGDFMHKNYPPGFTYQDFAPEFKAEFFNATHWANIIHSSGAKYVVLTSKHHEGYTMWPSSRSFSWNSVDTGPHRDVVGEVSRAVKKKGMHFGVYYSLYEWFNQIYLRDKLTQFTQQDYVDHKMIPELHELVYSYHPDVIWTDGDWEAPDKYFRAEEFLSWLYNDSPVKDSVVVNDRWGKNIMCHHGGVYTCTDRFNPHTLQKHKWENCMTIDKESWGYRRNADISDYFTVKELINELVTTVSCGGNLLMNVAATKEGTIAPIFQERLQSIGEWLQINGESIYNTIPWEYQNDTLNGDVWYTQSYTKTIIYANILKWPDENILKVKALLNIIDIISTVSMLGVKGDLKWVANDTERVFIVNLPSVQMNDCSMAWTLKVSTGPKVVRSQEPTNTTVPVATTHTPLEATTAQVPPVTNPAVPKTDGVRT